MNRIVIQKNVIMTQTIWNIKVVFFKVPNQTVTQKEILFTNINKIQS